MEQSKLDSFFTRPAPNRKKVQETFSSLRRLNHDTKEAQPCHAAAQS